MPTASLSESRSRGSQSERRLIILGSTGSIGTQTIEVIGNLNRLHGRGAFPFSYRVVGLAAGKNGALLREQAAHLGVARTALGTDGDGAAERLVREVECDMVLAAMVGSAGLPATLAAVQLGRDVALANKETLVAAGALVVPAAKKSGSRLLPVDSEHCALWQCLAGGAECGVRSAEWKPPCPPMVCGNEVARVVLTASGGPFRTKTKEEIHNATPEQALNHPTWKMGPKVTIDSATLTNKALEIIEAHWLFGLPGEKIDVLVHPQSIVHALVEYADGNVIAQLAPPDMRTPIQYALSFPARPPGISRKLDWAAMSRLDFAPPDRERFPALGLAYEAIRLGGTAGAVLNAANEAAVEAFLGTGRAGPSRQMCFGMIPELARDALKEIGVSPLGSLDDAMRADAEARRYVWRRLGA